MWTLVWNDRQMWDMKEREFEYALEVATYDATSLLLESRSIESTNQLWDGIKYTDFGKKFEINHNDVVERLQTTFDMNISSRNIYNMPLIGVAGYDVIDIYLTNKGWLGSSSYTYFDQNLNISYLFTLGDEFEILDYSTGNKTTYNISSYTSPYANLPIGDLKDFAVMTSINRVVSSALSLDDNLSTLRSQEGVELQLSLSEVASSGGSALYNSYQNIIRSPGVFAVIDEFGYGMDMRRIRLMSFGGAELELID